MALNGSAGRDAQPDLEDLQSDPRQHTSNRNVRDATGTQPAHTEAADRPLNKYSRTITQSKSQGGSQAMLYATGMTEGDMDKPQVGSDVVHTQPTNPTCKQARIPQAYCTSQRHVHSGGYIVRVVGGEPMQHAPARPSAGGQGGRSRGWYGRFTVQYHRS